MSGNFWLLCGLLCGPGNALYLRLRLQPYIASGELAKGEVNSFAVRLGLWILLPCLMLWLLQWSAGPEATADMLEWPNPQRGIAIALQVFVWAALVYWLFLNNGATTLSRYSRYHWFFAGVPPVIFKLLGAAAVLGGLAALLVGRA